MRQGAEFAFCPSCPEIAPGCRPPAPGCQVETRVPAIEPQLSELDRIGDASATAIVSDGSFSVAEGELALAPGSSGWPRREGGERRFIELFLRGGSASPRLGRPASGTPVVVSRTSASQ